MTSVTQLVNIHCWYDVPESRYCWSYEKHLLSRRGGFLSCVIFVDAMSLFFGHWNAGNFFKEKSTGHTRINLTLLENFQEFCNLAHGQGLRVREENEKNSKEVTNNECYNTHKVQFACCNWTLLAIFNNFCSFNLKVTFSRDFAPFSSLTLILDGLKV